MAANPVVSVAMTGPDFVPDIASMKEIHILLLHFSAQLWLAAKIKFPYLTSSRLIQGFISCAALESTLKNDQNFQIGRYVCIQYCGEFT